MKNISARSGLVVLAAAASICWISASAQSPGIEPTPASLSLSVVVGRWARTEGPYVINIKSVDVNGKLDATYANPKPLPFHSAQVVRDGSGLKLLFELRAGGYGGSTYTLNYDTGSDSLRGVYNQVVLRQKFGVIFNRTE